MSRRAATTRAWPDRSLSELLEGLASRSATVGGGSAAASVAALAAALLERCASQAGLGSEQARAAALRAALGDLIDGDAAARDLLQELAGDLASLAREIEAAATERLRGTARCARILASSARDAAEAIVGEGGYSIPDGPARSGSSAALAVVELTPHGPGSGPLWGMQSEELNATLLSWPPGHEIAGHRNDECEVMLVVLAGCARVQVDGCEHRVSAGQLLLIPRGCVRSVVAGPDGVRYLSTHRRRGPLLPTNRSGR
jgi:quercetin dioxygenase-like cupin family protein